MPAIISEEENPEQGSCSGDQYRSLQTPEVRTYRKTPINSPGELFFKSGRGRKLLEGGS